MLFPLLLSNLTKQSVSTELDLFNVEYMSDAQLDLPTSLKNVFSLHLNHSQFFEGAK